MHIAWLQPQNSSRGPPQFLNIQVCEPTVIVRTNLGFQNLFSEAHAFLSRKPAQIPPRRFACALYFPFCLFPDSRNLRLSGSANSLSLGRCFNRGPLLDSRHLGVEIRET